MGHLTSEKEQTAPGNNLVMIMFCCVVAGVKPGGSFKQITRDKYAHQQIYSLVITEFDIHLSHNVLLRCDNREVGRFL